MRNLDFAWRKLNDLPYSHSLTSGALNPSSKKDELIKHLKNSEICPRTPRIQLNWYVVTKNVRNIRSKSKIRTILKVYLRSTILKHDNLHLPKKATGRITITGWSQWSDLILLSFYKKSCGKFPRIWTSHGQPFFNLEQKKIIQNCCQFNLTIYVLKFKFHIVN